MKRARGVRGGVAALVACSLTVAEPAASQHSPPGSGSGERSSSFGVSYLAPALRFAIGPLRADAGAIVLSHDGGGPGVGGDVRVGALVLPGAGVSVAVRGARWGWLADGDALGGSELGAEVVREGRDVRLWASWTGIGAGDPGPARAATRRAAGAGWERGRLRLDLALLGTSFEDSVTIRSDTVFELAGYSFRSTRTRRALADVAYLDAEAGAGLAVGRGSVGLVLGAREGRTRVEGDRWGRLHASVALPALHLTVDAAVGIRPAMPERTLPRARFASVGLRWTPGARRDPPGTNGASGEVNEEARAEVVRLDDGQQALALMNVYGRTVDVMGDFTDWRAMALAPSGADAWLLRVALRPGTYGFLVRIDSGEWHVPLGLLSTEGDFGSPVGVLVVPAEVP